MKTKIIASIAVALFTAAFVTAQTPSEPSSSPTESGTVTGRVVLSARDTIAILTSEGESMSFLIEPGTEPVAEGDVVRIEFEEQDDGQLRALTVELVPEEEPTASLMPAEKPTASLMPEEKPTAAEPDNGDNGDNGHRAATAMEARSEPESDPQQQQTSAAAQAEELPRTASDVPAILLAGLSLVAAGFGVRALRTRQAA